MSGRPDPETISPPTEGTGCPTGADGSPSPDDQGAEADCDEVISQLYSYLDGELAASAVTELETHLHRCSPCLEAYDFEAELRRVIVSRCQEQVPQDLKDRLCALLERLQAGGLPDAGPGTVS